MGSVLVFSSSKYLLVVHGIVYVPILVTCNTINPVQKFMAVDLE